MQSRVPLGPGKFHVVVLVTVYKADWNLKFLETVVNYEPLSVYNWLIANKLSLDIEKWNYIIFHPYQNRPNSSGLEVNFLVHLPSFASKIFFH